MNLTSKLQDLKNELKQREDEKNAAHNRIIMLRRLIKSTESLISDAENIFAVEDATNEVIRQIKGSPVPIDNGAMGFTEGADLAKSDNGHLSV